MKEEKKVYKNATQSEDENFFQHGQKIIEDITPEKIIFL